jgi:hypothetical protein
VATAKITGTWGTGLAGGDRASWSVRRAGLRSVSHRSRGQFLNYIHVWKEIQACMRAGSAAYALAISDAGIPDERLSMSHMVPYLKVVPNPSV